MDDTKIIKLNGFDEGNEPEIRIQKDNSIYLVFNFFPPESFELSEADLDGFENDLSVAIKQKVSHGDREFFYIPKNNATTVNLIKVFIENYKQNKGYL